MIRKLKRIFKKKFEEGYITNKTKLYFPLLEKIYYSLFLDDLEFAKIHYLKKFDKALNIYQPVSFTEKIQWLKLNDRSELHTICADKLAVRDFVTKTIGPEYLIPLIFNTKNPEDITTDTIPEFPVIIKPNHDSGTHFIIRNKKDHDFKKIRKSLKQSLQKNYYFFWREWQYKNIIPSIIVEKLLTQENGQLPYDYKFHCFNGKMNFIQVSIDSEHSIKINLHDENWNLLPFQYEYENAPITPVPKKLKLMIKLAEKLAKPFSYVRIDFYENNNKVFFGEITFHPTSGFGQFTPTKWDLKMGEKIILPN